MTAGKRVFDIVLCLWLILWLGLPIVVISVLILLRDGFPIFYRSERMLKPGQSFTLWKFRTMRVKSDDGGVSGGDKTGRVTAFGRSLRRRRLDELPQLWNIFKGDISFVGPRPPLRQYVSRFPDIYSEVLKSRPGVTGLATIFLHGREERLLSSCKSPEETDKIYTTQCLPVKARLDLIYQHNRSVCMDIWLIWRTMVLAFGPR
ncbi:MAG: sugar transferase [Halocynthiibacter sp.]